MQNMKQKQFSEITILYCLVLLNRVPLNIVCVDGVKYWLEVLREIFD